MGMQDNRNGENNSDYTSITVEGPEGSRSKLNLNKKEESCDSFLVTKDAKQSEDSRRHQDQSMEDESSTSPIVTERAGCSENQEEGIIKKEPVDPPTVRERCGGSRRQHDPSTPTTQRAKKILVNTGSLPPPPKTAPPPLPLQIL